MEHLDEDIGNAHLPCKRDSGTDTDAATQTYGPVKTVVLEEIPQEE